jgi:hypothetical protein
MFDGADLLSDGAAKSLFDLFGEISGPGHLKLRQGENRHWKAIKKRG